MSNHPHDISNPRFAVIAANALSGIGMKSILEKIIPMIEVVLFRSCKEMNELSSGEFIHYFIDSQAFVENSRFFLSHPHQVILLTATEIPEAQGINSINTNLSEEQIVRDILRLHHNAHAKSHNHTAHRTPDTQQRPLLTAREREVLVLIAKGLINKEISDRMGIGLTTVITHRKNITRKLGIKSISGLTIYAVMRGYIDADSI